MSQDADALLQTGYQYYLAGRYSEALQSFDEAKQQAPANPQIYKWSGYVRLAMREVQPALTEWEQAARLAPDDGSIYLAMASAYNLVGEKKSVRELREMVSRFPGDGASREIALGLLAIQRKDFPQALSHYENAAQQRPDAAYIAGYIGHAQLLLGYNQEARASYRLATQDPVASPSAFYNLAIAEMRLRNYDAATQALQSAVQGDSNYQKAYLKLSKVEIRRWRWRSSWRYLRQALRCIPVPK